MHGFELWKSNGTAAGTVMVKDINPGKATSYPLFLTNVNGTLFFQANDGVHGMNSGRATAPPPAPSWSRTSTPGARLESYPPDERQWHAVLRANDGVHGLELWKSNGTAAGTVLVKDINPGSAGSDPLQPDERQRHAVLRCQRRRTRS